MWISIGIAVSRIGAIWSTNIVARRVFQTGTAVFVVLSVFEARQIRKKRDEAYRLSREGFSQNDYVAKQPSDEVPF